MSERVVNFLSNSHVRDVLKIEEPEMRQHGAPTLLTRVEKAN